MRGTEMRFRTWPVAAVGLASLLLLVVYTVITASQRRRRRSTRSSTSSTRTTARSTPSCGGCAPTCTSPASSSATTCSTPSASTPPSIAAARRISPSKPRHADGAARACRRSTTTTARIAACRRKLERLLAGVRAAVRLDDRRKRSRRARGFLRREVLPRREAVLAHRPGNRGAQQRQPRRAARRGHPPAGGVPQRLYTLLWRSLLLGFVVAATAVIRLRVLEAALGGAEARCRRRPSGRCASCRSSSWRRRRKSEASCRASCTITSARC